MKRLIAVLLIAATLMAVFSVQALACCGPYLEQYISNEDGTHSVFLVCEECGIDGYFGGREVCEADENDLCVFCGGAVESCAHLRAHDEICYTQYSVLVEPHHYHNAEEKSVCNDCGKVVRTQKIPMAVCQDADEDLVCDVCFGQLHYEHRFRVTASYEPQYNGSHTLRYTCTSCDFFVEVSQMCVKEKGVCILCGGQTSQEDKDVSGINMTLGNELTINVLVRADSLPDGVCSAVFTQEDRASVTEELKPYNDIYYAAAYPVAAKEMTDRIYVQVLDEDGSEIIPAMETSVQEYALGLLRRNETALKLSRVVVDLLNYGTQAQEFFDYRTDSYANAALTTEEASYATASVVYEDARQASDNLIGTSLALEERISVKLHFRVKGAVAAEYRYINYLGKAVSGTCQVADIGKNRCVVTVNAQVVADAKCPVRVTVYGQGGEEIAWCEDSVEGYASRAKDSVCGQLTEAILKFASSAYAYFNGISWQQEGTVFAIEAVDDVVLEDGTMMPGEACRIGGPVEGYGIFETAPESYPVIRKGTLRLIGQTEDGENVYLSVGQTEDAYGEDYVAITCGDYDGDLVEKLPGQEAMQAKWAYRMTSSGSLTPQYRLDTIFAEPMDPTFECYAGFVGQYWLAPDGSFAVATAEMLDCTSEYHNLGPLA